MVTREAGSGPPRPARGARRRVRAWVAWAAAVLVLWILSQPIGAAAGPEWAEEVALVLVIAVAVVSAPPVLARISTLPVDLPPADGRGQEAAVIPIGPSRGPSSLAG
ncbi:hypothetical protein [Micromonospora thermarum]|uniref:Uncharacterized protein n=1 Tax=Micromonospora thermarum TaxID=2720024 RepID=A0ABX0ZEF6_9ACTN|nr:hypothetical protein [Micromonospora thermarum]NJP35369.1 hypothetical protein [Micromonospora thermarum]